MPKTRLLKSHSRVILKFLLFFFYLFHTLTIGFLLSYTLFRHDVSESIRLILTTRSTHFEVINYRTSKMNNLCDSRCHAKSRTINFPSTTTPNRGRNVSRVNPSRCRGGQCISGQERVRARVSGQVRVISQVRQRPRWPVPDTRSFRVVPQRRGRCDARVMTLREAAVRLCVRCSRLQTRRSALGYCARTRLNVLRRRLTGDTTGRRTGGCGARSI